MQEKENNVYELNFSEKSVKIKQKEVLECEKDNSI